MMLLIPTAIAPSLTALNTKQKIDDFANIKNTSTIKGGLIDKVHIRVFSMFFGYACNLEFLHKNNESIDCMYYLNVTKKDGTQLFETETSYDNNLPPNFDVTWNLMSARSFREVGYPLGFFRVTVDFYVLTDGSSKQITFHGLVYYINALYFDSWKDWKFP
jgi:hypothetical protein